jgi:D-glycero-alpha-D-manno-heptose-7-phosphate kinase
MILSKTPLRISLFGGGSDLSSFYNKYPGSVLSSSIDKYIYITVNKKFDNGIRIAYSVNEEVDSVDKIQHNIARETLRKFKIKGGIEITTIADIPSKGSGLGSSSSFTVGLVNSLQHYLGNIPKPHSIAEDACEIEIECCKEPIGKQDQYAAAFGDFNLIEFLPSGDVLVEPLNMGKENLKALGDHLLLFYTGITRKASSILEDQSKQVLKSEKKVDSIKQMVEIAHSARDILFQGEIEEIGFLLDKCWKIKSKLASGISNSFLDKTYDKAIDAGAHGGKILGAGGGGFFLFFTTPANRKHLIESLPELTHVPFEFTNSGSNISYKD